MIDLCVQILLCRWFFIFGLEKKERTKGAVTQCTISCNLSGSALEEKLQMWRRHTVQRNGMLVEIVFERRTELYFPQRFLWLVSQRFQPLQDMLRWRMVRAICIGIARQVARKITHCNSAISLLPHKHHARNLFFIAIAFAVSLRDRGPVSNVCAAVVLSWLDWARPQYDSRATGLFGFRRPI